MEITLGLFLFSHAGVEEKEMRENQDDLRRLADYVTKGLAGAKA